ncbi:NAD(P)(+)--arginine ADP-ribosyltransferase 2-like [Clarias gariepinus]|uniref:NAD(P)(+)--arginine ADP-ribosyltransferase 2-like n=1 Tax=Clarias gariepinus TaxID=13013 RepID=UPI00234D1845|nr:NAD(P)(+)--arginine ADP-ribosyltransferase 2-like [Clarias gariepinus]XP_053367849.1 NAD(P)(+)--arginine ADP-ribosyltransferase 2-like [Clarias gariepinus]XP_053367850.1 NAD(P)(+)--arginine ADP-ribosyltransferase 2-like [Clarias gariepinus]
MKEAVKFFNIIKNAGITAILISVVCYAKNPHWTSDSVFKLDMAPDSVDDQFIDCEDQTNNLIKKGILKNELKHSKLFSKVWKEFENVSDDLQKIIKVYTYTLPLYSEFNNALRSGRKNYKKKFNYKSFHFLLTCAVRKYKMMNCVDVFRKTNVSFDTNVVNREMRFGQFTSTSTRDDLHTFGNKSCFQINTCYGANITNMSFHAKEEEVLIPPFEKFKITKIEYNQRNCSVLYSLQSTGTCSNMNCELIKKSTLYHTTKNEDLLVQKRYDLMQLCSSKSKSLFKRLEQEKKH